MNEVEHAVLNGLYNTIPPLGDCKGCSECCGPIQWLPIEEENIREYLQVHGMPLRTKVIPPPEILQVMDSVEMDKALLCPYSGKDGCDIYPVRPLMCRLFGVIGDYPTYDCPNMKAEKTITKKAAIELWRRVAEMR